MSTTSGPRPPPTAFFQPTSRFQHNHRQLHESNLRVSLLSTLSDLANIAVLAAREDTSASTVDTQPLPLQSADKQSFLPALVLSPARKRTGTSHLRFRSEQPGTESLSLPQSSQVVREQFLHLVDAADREDLKAVETVYYMPPKRRPKTIVKGEDWYPIVAGDHFGFRYEVLEFLGLGAFGKVSRCYDHRTGETVALKVFKKSSKAYERQAGVEMKLFQALQARESPRSKIVTLKGWFKFRGHVCLVYELLSLTLQACLQQNDFRGFSPGWIRRVTYDLLDALVELKSCNILHCDLKPDNIAFTQDNRTSIKLIDLGSGVFENQTMYTYIQSRYYRAPEVILGCAYSFPIDMWSLGCVVAELFLGRALFTGEDKNDQLLAIMEVLGPPPDSLLQSASNFRLYFTDTGRPKILPSSCSKRQPGSLPLARAIPTSDASFLDFIASKLQTGCLQWDPQQRLIPEQGLVHPFVLGGLRPEKTRQKSIKRLSQASLRTAQHRKTDSSAI